jgi:hypothetical protein
MDDEFETKIWRIIYHDKVILTMFWCLSYAEKQMKNQLITNDDNLIDKLTEIEENIREYLNSSIRMDDKIEISDQIWQDVRMMNVHLMTWLVFAHCHLIIR